MRLAHANVGRVPRWVWGVLLGMHLLVFNWGLVQRRWLFPDSDRYIEAAHNLWVHQVLYARPWAQRPVVGQAIQEFSIRPPGYPMLILLTGASQLQREPILLLLLQNLLSLLNISSVLKWWAWRAQPTARQWGWAMVVVCLPAQLIYANTLMSELVVQTLVLIMAISGARLWSQPNTLALTGTVMALSAALLVKPVFYPLAGIVAVWGLGLAWYHRRSLWAVVGILPLAVTLLYMSWNDYRTGYFHFSSITDINLLHYNAAGVIRQIGGPAAEEQWVADVLGEANSQPNFALRQRVIQARAGAMLASHPLVYAGQHLQGMLTFFLDPGRFDISRFFHLAEPAGGGLLVQIRAAGAKGLLRGLQALPIGLLAILGVVLLTNVARILLAIRGFCYANKTLELRNGRWWLAFLIFYVAFLTGPLGAARFLVPVWPLLLLFALCGLKPIRDVRVDG